MVHNNLTLLSNIFYCSIIFLQLYSKFSKKTAIRKNVFLFLDIVSLFILIFSIKNLNLWLFKTFFIIKVFIFIA
jgi:hypothetical protein